MELYCKLFIDSSMPKESLESLIVKVVSGDFDGFTISCSVCEIDIQENEEWDSSRVGEPDGFLSARFFADVEPVSGCGPQRYVDMVTNVVRELKRSGCMVVPSCDFEDAIIAKL